MSDRKYWYFIKYEYNGETYEARVEPGENPIYRCMSITDAGGKIVDIIE
jgi:hypothetical protein